MISSGIHLILILVYLLLKIIKSSKKSDFFSHQQQTFKLSTISLSFFKISSSSRRQKSSSASGQQCLSPEEMEKPQNFSQSPQAFDAVFFSGAKNGLTLIVATERRPKNVTYGIVYLMVTNYMIINQT